MNEEIIMRRFVRDAGYILTQLSKKSHSWVLLDDKENVIPIGGDTYYEALKLACISLHSITLGE